MANLGVLGYWINDVDWDKVSTLLNLPVLGFDHFTVTIPDVTQRRRRGQVYKFRIGGHGV